MSEAQSGSVHRLLEEAAATARRIEEDESDFGPGRLYAGYESEQMAVVSAAEKDLDAIISRLSDTSPWVRGEAARIVGFLFAREAVPHLIGLQNDPDARVRDAVREALAWITGVPEAVALAAPSSPVRLATLCAVVREHPISLARRYAARALAGTVAAVPMLAAAMTDSASHVRSEAFSALAATPCAAALDALCSVARGGEQEAIRGIGRIWHGARSDAALEAVEAQVESSTRNVASAARSALAQMAAHESDPRRRTRLVDFVVRTLSPSRRTRLVDFVVRKPSPSWELHEAAYGIAAALADERLAAVIARTTTPPRGRTSSLKLDALDACGDAADAALLAALRDSSLSNEAREAALAWASVRGLVAAPPGFSLAYSYEFIGRWRDREGRVLQIWRGESARALVKLVPPSDGAEAREGSTHSLRALEARAEVGSDGCMRFTLGYPPRSASFTLRRLGSLLVAEVELLGQASQGDPHPLEWLSPASPFRRDDLPSRRSETSP